MFIFQGYGRFAFGALLTSPAHTLVVFVNNKKCYIWKTARQDRYFDFIGPLISVAYDVTYLLFSHLFVMQCTENQSIVVCDIFGNESP